MKEKAAVVYTILMMSMSLRYSWLTWQGEIQPVLMTWLLFYIVISMSLWTYWSSEKHSIISNIANAIDFIAVGIILLSVIFLGENIRLEFNRFEMWCLAAAGVIIAFWRISSLHKASNLLLQAVMTIAYFPTLRQLWYAQENTESLGVWLVGWVAMVVALIPAIKDRDGLAIVYASRALIMTMAVVGLIIRLEMR